MANYVCFQHYRKLCHVVEKIGRQFKKWVQFHFKDGGYIRMEFLFWPPQPSAIKRKEVMSLLEFVFCGLRYTAVAIRFAFLGYWFSAQVHINTSQVYRITVLCYAIAGSLYKFLEIVLHLFPALTSIAIVFMFPT